MRQSVVLDNLMRMQAEGKGAAAIHVVDLVSDDEDEEVAQAEPSDLGALMDVVPGDLDPFLDTTSDTTHAKITNRLRHLAPDTEKDVTAVLHGPRDQEVVIDKFNIDMTREKIYFRASAPGSTTRSLTFICACSRSATLPYVKSTSTDSTATSLTRSLCRSCFN